MQQHQRPRDDSRDICSPDVCQGSAEYSGALEDGQYISCVVRDSEEHARQPCPRQMSSGCGVWTEGSDSLLSSSPGRAT